MKPERRFLRSFGTFPRSFSISTDVGNVPMGTSNRAAVGGYPPLGLLLYPLLGLIVVRADKYEFVLSPALYQLVGFDDQFLGCQPFVFSRQLGHVGFWSDGDILVWDFVLSVGVVFE